MEAGEFAWCPIAGQHLLPETGLEHQAVSYSKGCYPVGEVIARVRTMGVFPERCEVCSRRSESVPPPGSDVLNGEGKKIGQGPPGHSLEAGGLGVCLLNRDSRTPGNQLMVQLESGVQSAVVALFRCFAPRTARSGLPAYDKAVRVTLQAASRRRLTISRPCCV